MFLPTGAVRAEFPNTTFAYSTNVTMGDLQRKQFNLLNIEFPSMGTRTASPRGRYGERPQRDSCLKIHM